MALDAIVISIGSWLLTINIGISIELVVNLDVEFSHARQTDLQRNILVSLRTAHTGTKLQPVAIGLVIDKTLKNACLAEIVSNETGKIVLHKTA